MNNLTAIVAMTESGVIGVSDGNRLPWPRLPKDMARFRQTTMGGVCIVGRRTWLGLPGELPGRIPVVLTRFAVGGAGAPFCPAATPCQAVEFADDLSRGPALAPIFVIGGAQTYAALLPSCSRLLVTIVHGDYPGDVLWPGLLPWQDGGNWRLALPMIPADDGPAGGIPVTFAEYERAER